VGQKATVLSLASFFLGIVDYCNEHTLKTKELRVGRLQILYQPKKLARDKHFVACLSPPSVPKKSVF